MVCSPEIESTLYFGRLRDAGLCFCRRWRRGHKGESGRRWGGRRLAEAGVPVNVAEKFFPAEIAESNALFVLYSFLAIEKKLGKIREKFGVTAGDAVGGHEFEEFADDMVDIGDGGEFAGKGREIRGDAIEFEELPLFTSVKEAEGVVGFVAEHATLAAVSEGEPTEARGIDGISGTRFLF
jgi:hypothetical protein